MQIPASIFSVGLGVVALYAVNLWLRLGDPHLTAIALSVTGIGMLAVSSWLGGAPVRIRGTNVRKVLRQRKRLHASSLVLCIALAGWTGSADAGPLSSTGPVIAVLGGELLVGEVTAHLAGWGTIALRSRSDPALTCVGEFSATEALGDAGQLRCSDGASATFEFQRLSLRRGYGVGSSNRGALSFTYGLSAEESAPYLKLPPGKALSQDGSSVRLVAAAPYPLR